MDWVRPEWWGAVPDGVVECKTAIDAAVVAYHTVLLNKGTYKYHGKMYWNNLDGRKLQGQGCRESILYFTDTTQTCCIDIETTEPTPGHIHWCNRVVFDSLWIKGPGKAEGTTIDGIYSHGATPSMGFCMNNVIVSDLSGNGIDTVLGHNAVEIRNSSARSIALNGFITGSQEG